MWELRFVINVKYADFTKPAAGENEQIYSGACGDTNVDE